MYDENQNPSESPEKYDTPDILPSDGLRSEGGVFASESVQNIVFREDARVVETDEGALSPEPALATSVVSIGGVGDGENDSASVLDLIYARFSDLFGQGTNSHFCMEFPGRVLNQKLYAYDSDNLYAEIRKPQTVLEQEFRLTNDLFDIDTNQRIGASDATAFAQIVSGPNGIRLSEAYKTALNALVPKWDINADFIADQKKIRGWLLQTVTGTVDGKEVSCTRVELFERLNSRYLNRKADWEWYKREQFKKATAAGTDEAMEEYARWLAREAPVQQALIDGYFSDLISRGYYHEVMGNMAYLDVTSTSESVYEAKSSLRHVSMSALDESHTVYPVQMQPNDWFRGLSTDFQSEDLLFNANYLSESLLKKQAELEVSEKRLAHLMTRQEGYEGKLQSLQEKIDKQQEAIDKLNVEIWALYDKTIIEGVKLAFKTLQFGANPNPNKEAKELVASTAKAAISAATGIPVALLDIDMKAVEEIWSYSTEIARHEAEINSISRSLSQVLLAKAEAKSFEAGKEIELLDKRIVMLKKEIQYIEAMIYSSSARNFITEIQTKLSQINTRKAEIRESAKKATVELEISLDDAQLELADVMNQLMDLENLSSDPDVDVYKEAERLTVRKTQLEAIIKDCHTKLGGQLNAEGKYNSIIEGLRKDISVLEKSEADNAIQPSIQPMTPPPSRWTDFTMSFTAKEVNQETHLSVGSSTVNTGLKFGWVRASGQRSSASMSFWDKMRTTDTTIQLGFRATKVNVDRGWFRPQFFRMTKAMYKLVEGISISSDPMKLTDILPAYPTGFLLVKDVTIKYDNVQENRSDVKKMLETSASVSGGFLCFSAQASHGSKHESQAFFWKYSGTSVTIRIPGPQIIGWFLNQVPEDVSAPYEKMPDYYLP